MANILIEEPRVKVNERIREYPIQLDIDGGCNIGGVIVAPTGPRLSYVTGPNDFLKKYTVDGNIPRNADISFLNAYYLSFAAGLVIARSMNTTATNGLFFTVTSDSWYKLPIDAEDQAFWAVGSQDKLYFSNNGNSDFEDFINILSQLSEDNKSLVEKYKAYTTKVSCADFEELASALSSDSNEVIYDEVSGMLISKSDLSLKDPYEISVGKSTSESVNSLTGNKINYKDGVALNKTQVLTLSIGEDFSSKNFAFVVGTMAYYHGAIDKSEYSDYSLVSINSINDLATSISGMAGMTAEVTNSSTTYDYKVKISYSEGNSIGEVDSSKIQGGITVKLEDVADPTLSKYGTEVMLFAVRPEEAQDSDKYLISIAPNNGTLFNLTLRDSLGESTTYETSLLADELDSAGTNAYIENLNALDLGFTFETNPEFKFNGKEGEEAIQQVKFTIKQSFGFGDSGLSLSASKDITCKVNALYALEDQEKYDIDYLAPFGETNLNFIKNYCLVGKNNDWFSPVGIPWNKTNPNSIKSYFLNVPNSSNVQAMGPYDKNIGLTGWMFYLDSVSLYYSRVMANRAAGKEFAPVFDITNGVLDYTNPAYELGKEDRTALLNMKCPINFVVYNQRASVYYFNDNRTHQSDNNIVSEEQNRRLVNKIKRDCKRILQRFKGRLNTVSTRNDVESTLKYYFRTEIMSQQYKPNDYEIICDESNNTTEIITANKLAVTVRVRLENAIKFIDVLVDVFPLGVDFTK